MSVNPLSNPKGIELKCELCQRPAFVKCTKCRVTFYCGKEHQMNDWVGIHEKICQLLIPLRTPVPFAGSEEERQHRQEQQIIRQKQMIDLARTTGQKLLFEGKHVESIPAAIQALRFSIAVHGTASVELVPSYLILAEAAIGLGKLSEAEDYLAQAEWTVLKTPTCPSHFRSRLYRNLGLLAASNGLYDDALRNYANDIFYASQDMGPSDIATSGGYFHMANVFFRQNQMLVADSLYDKVTEIWMKHLQKLTAQRRATPTKRQTIGPVFEEADVHYDYLDEAQTAEAKQVLNAIFDLRQQQTDDKYNEKRMKIAYTLSMLYCLLSDEDKCKLYCQTAKTASENREKDDLSLEIEEFDKFCQRSMTVSS